MPRLGEGVSREELRVEDALTEALKCLPNMNRRSLNYTLAVVPVASPMHSGVDGNGWRVESDGGHRFFLKLYEEDTAEFLDLTTSFKASAVAGSAGLAPKLLWSGLPMRAALWEYKAEPWRTAIFDDTWRREVVSGATGSLRRLHGGQSFGRVRDVFEDLESHVALANKRAVTLPVDFDWMLGNVRDIAQVIAAAGFDRRPCHGDLIASNIMIGPQGETLFVDWDEAGDGDPYWDIGMYMAEAFPFDEPALAMIEDYAGRADGKLLARARLYGIAGDLAWAVRSLILAQVTRRTEVEYFKYAQWRALRCRVSMHDPKFEQMLRSL